MYTNIFFLCTHDEKSWLTHDVTVLLLCNDDEQLFAPTDDAFLKVPQVRMEYLGSNAGRNDLKKLLSQHIVVGAIPLSDLQKNSTTTVASLLPGSNLTIVKSADGKVTVNGIAAVVTPDVVSVNTNKCGAVLVGKNGTIDSLSTRFYIMLSRLSFVSWRAMALSSTLIRCWSYQIRQPRRMLL
jgi:Fasciclin domain